jgi:hypothetical protein
MLVYQLEHLLTTLLDLLTAMLYATASLDVTGK